jgi:hypothetical protein
MPGIIQNTAVIKKAFPALPITFYDVLTDRLIAHGFCNDRFAASVIHVVDTCHYPTPTIADFLSYDKKILKITTKSLDEIR